MCGRYFFENAFGQIELEELIEALNRRAPNSGAKVEGEVRPTDTVPVIANSRSMNPGVFAMKWGFSTPRGQLVINARSETAGERPLFRDSLRDRRCAVPASGYYEWERAGRERVKYAIRPAEAGLMLMAGLYRLEAGRPVFTILTRRPEDNIRFIHDRMPVLLPREALNDWLDPRRPAEALLEGAGVEVDWARAPGEDGDAVQLSML